MNHSNNNIMDYSNLKNKTIYDFCNDESIINDLVVSKEDFFRDLEEYPLLNAHVLIEYAEMTNNDELLQAVQSQYKAELEAENNEWKGWGKQAPPLLFWRFAVRFLSVYYTLIDNALVIAIWLVFGNSESP